MKLTRGVVSIRILLVNEPDFRQFYGLAYTALLISNFAKCNWLFYKPNLTLFADFFAVNFYELANFYTHLVDFLS